MMVRLRSALERQFFVQLLPCTVLAVPLAIGYVLLAPGVLHWRDTWPQAFVLVHSMLIVACLGRPRSSSFAFLYTRGYPRDVLWAHMMLASARTALFTWLVAALALWTGARSYIQDHICHSPDFPVMAEREALVPWVWLLAYVVLLPTFHYAWIRAAQPTGGRHNGRIVAASVVIAALVVIGETPRAEWFRWFACVACMLVAATMLVAGRALHRRLEVKA